MKHFLVVYNRREGQIIQRRAYNRSQVSAALRDRFAAEREYKGQPDIEVVVLGGQSWRSVERTHSRYFSGVHDLAKTGLDRLAVART
jgi:hypothetical protein